MAKRGKGRGKKAGSANGDRSKPGGSQAPRGGAAGPTAASGSTSRRAGSEAPSPAHEIHVPAWLPWMLYVAATLFLFREFIASRDMLFGGDTLGLGYMARAFYAEALQGGEFPLWNPIILGGTPFLESLAGGDSLYPPSVLLLALLEPHRALGWKLVLHVLAAGPLMALWARSLGISKASATICGLAYMVAPFFVALVYPGHDGKMFVTALAPLCFWAMERALAQGGLHRWGALAGTIGLVILTTHFQMAYFLFGAMGAYAIFRTIQLGRLSGTWGQPGARLATFLAVAVLGAGIAAVQLLPAVTYVKDFSRRAATTTQAQSPEAAIAYSSSYSLHPEEAMSLVVPEFIGGNVSGTEWTENTYWGRNFFKSNHEYIGWVVLILALLSFFGAPRRSLRLLLFGLGAVALLFALGRTTPVWRLFYEVVPGISDFRAPSQIIFLTGFAWITLAGFGIDQGLRIFAPGRRLSDDERRRADRAERTLWGVGALMLVLTLLAASGVLQSLWTSVIYRDIQDAQLAALERASPFITRGFFITLLFTLVVVGAWSALRRSWLAPAGVVAVLGLAALVDGIRVDDPYIQTMDFDQWSAPDPNIRFLMGQISETEPWRLMSRDGPQPGQDVGPGMYGIELAGGHHPNDLLRYRDLTGMVGSGEAVNLFQNPQLLSMLNVRYLLWPVIREGELEGLPEVSRAVLQDGRVLSAVYELPALPRARLVANARIVPDDETIGAMLQASFDPANEVLLTEEPSIALDGGTPSGSVTWTSRSNNRSVLEVTSDRPALLVIADNWFPAWKAEVNGESTPVLRAYHTLRAIPVGAGTSTVEMFYSSEELNRALWISLVCGVLALAMGLTAFRKSDRSPADLLGADTEPEPIAS